MARQALTPERVVDAAQRIVDSAGADALTVSRLAADLGVRPPSLYKHVDGLDDVQVRLRLLAIDRLRDTLAAACVGRSGPDAVRAMAAAWREFGQRHPGLLALTVPETESGHEAVHTAGRRVLEVVLRVLAGFGLEGAAALHATRTLRAALHGFAVLETSGGFGMSDLDPDVSFEWLVSMLVAGLEHPPASQ